MLSRLFSAADGASGKRFDEAFRVRVVGAPASGWEEGGESRDCLAREIHTTL